jgi:hypothetical protein
MDATNQPCKNELNCSTGISVSSQPRWLTASPRHTGTLTSWLNGNRSLIRLSLLANGLTVVSARNGSWKLATMTDDSVADWLALATLVLFLSTMAYGIAAILA